ncbi:MAG: DUF488 domain-containing protein [Verrucomicrobiae bacterium]|nr:DUF488 domain-containing protein [Verrucomicrobiae bacterium]
MEITLKRIYEKPDPEDGYRVLVDRLWPRGVSKERAGLDCWLKEVAPSDALRTWFKHEPAKWPEFQSRYEAELQDHVPLLKQLLETVPGERITLLYAARDEKHNQAVVLQSTLQQLTCI